MSPSKKSIHEPLVWKPLTEKLAMNCHFWPSHSEKAVKLEQKILNTVLQKQYQRRIKKSSLNIRDPMHYDSDSDKEKSFSSGSSSPLSSSSSSSSSSSTQPPTTTHILLEKCHVPIKNGEDIPTVRATLKEKSPQQLQDNRPPIVAVHGMGGGLAMWALSVEMLTENSPNGVAYFIDLPGFATSSRGKPSRCQTKKTATADTTEEFFMESFSHWQDKINANKITLMGHSLGGYLSGCYALRFPDRVHHLILADPWGVKAKTTEDEERLHKAVPWWVVPAAKVADSHGPLFMLRCAGPLGKSVIRLRKNLGGELRNYFKKGEIDDYFYYCNTQKPTGEMRFMALQTSYVFPANPLCERLTALPETTKLDFIFGQNTWMDYETSLNLSKKMKNASFQFVQNAGHQVFVENPKGFNRAVGAVLESAAEK